MKVVQINTCSYGSTGRIAIHLCELIEKNGGTAYLCVPNGRHNKKPYDGHHLWIGNRFSEDGHLILSRLTGLNGYFSYVATKRFLRRINRLRPDVLHFHNLHNSYINLPLLFDFVKRHNIPVIWTLHDCWSFTGQCPHFTMVQCDKWKSGCHHCPQYRRYPQSYVDRTKRMYRKKREWFTGVERMTIVTPSRWLADRVRESYLRDYPVHVLHNGIDLNVFKPTEGNFCRQVGLDRSKHVVLGVAFGWGESKGLDVFVELSRRLDPAKYQIVMVGTDDRTDRQIPREILSVHRTANPIELTELYTAADVFINPTREDTFPTVNIEALACGTPVITFQTGGSPEIVDDTCGMVVPCNDIDAMEAAIRKVCDERLFDSKACIQRAGNYEKETKFQEYMDLYGRIV